MRIIPRVNHNDAAAKRVEAESQQKKQGDNK